MYEEEIFQVTWSTLRENKYDQLMSHSPHGKVNNNMPLKYSWKNTIATVNVLM